MKHVPCLRWVGHGVQSALLLAAMAVLPAAAENGAPPSIQSALDQTASGQTQVRVHTAAVAAQVQGLIDELAANGITGDDAKVLLATKAALANLSGPEMERVLASLRKAQTSANATDTTSNAVHAYTAQQGIILQFRLILKEYEQREAATELAARFKELTDRQTATMRTTADVARATAGIGTLQLSTIDQTTQQIVQSDQDAIVNEANVAHDQLDKAATDSTGDDAKALLKAQADMTSGEVQATLGRANDDLKAGFFLKAISEQIAARDQLHRITLDLTPPDNDVEAIAQTAADLAKLIEEQKKLLGQTTSAIDAKALASGLNDQQGVLVDEANLVQQDTLILSAPAADLVKAAINPPMQVSRAQLGHLDGLPIAVTSQQEAIEKLEAAQKLLQQQLTDAETKEKNAELTKANEPAPDPTALTTAATKLDEAQTNVNTALTDTTPPSPSANSPANPPNPTSPPASNPPQSSPPGGNPPDGTPPASPSMTDALNVLTKAETDTDAVANTPGLPDATKEAVKEAQKEIGQGKDDAAKGDAPGTASHAGAALAALTQAQATLALAMAGMPGPGNPGPPMPTPPGPSPPSLTNAQTVTPGSTQPNQLRAVPDELGNFVTVQNRIRVALGQSSIEKRPQEYAALIDQYLKNLADEASLSAQ